MKSYAFLIFATLNCAYGPMSSMVNPADDFFKSAYTLESYHRDVTYLIANS